MQGRRVCSDGREPAVVAGGGWLYRLRERLALRGTRLFFPAIHEAAQQEDADNPFDQKTGELPSHIHIVDRGSDTTIVSFSSVALLHTGQPAREFEAFFRRYGADQNLVFLRDVHRSCYHFTPDGGGDGLAFHEAELRSVLAQLGSTRTIAIGDSGGAAAAIYYGTRLGFDRVVAFSPPFPLRHWISPTAQLYALFNFKLLFREPRIYTEHVVNAIVPVFGMWLRLSLRCGFGKIWKPIEDYCAAPVKPRLTVFYGERSRPESLVVKPLRQFAEVDLRPLPTASHFGMAALARTGRLGPTILELLGPEADRPATAG